jgi:amino acid transporter
MLPKALGKTHPRWQSPHVASITQSVIAAVVIGLFALLATGDVTNQSYIELYGLMAVMGVIIILSVQALVSLSVAVYYLRYHRNEVHWWKTTLAPAISFISQAFVVYLLFANISFVAGTSALAKWLGPIDAVVAVAGVAAAFWFKYRRPATYEQAGRLINEGL